MANEKKATTSWMAKLKKEIDGAVQQRFNPFAKVVRTASPSFNRVFGKTHGLPQGYSAIFWGPWAGGKSLLSKSAIGTLHQEDPEAIAVLFDTEFRSSAQLPTDEDYAKFGIDPERLLIVETNSPEDIFNQIANKFKAMIQEGCPIKLIVIDSISNMMGLREQNNADISRETIGDGAKTIGGGMRMITPVIRNPKHPVSLIVIAHARAEMDQWAQRRNGHAYRMQAAATLKHLIEYFVFIEEAVTGEANKDVFGNDIRKADGKKQGEKKKWRIRGKMEKSSFGPTGRAFCLTFDRVHGFVEQWEEIAKMALVSKVVHKDGNSHTFGEQKWPNGKAYYTAVQSDIELQRAIMAEVLRRDTEEENEDFDEELEDEAA